MKKILFVFILGCILSCGNDIIIDNTATKDNSKDIETFNSHVKSIQDKLIKGFKTEDHDLIMSVFADTIKWNGPNKKLLNETSPYNEVSEAIKGYLATYENHNLKDVGYVGGNIYNSSMKPNSNPNNIRVYGNWHHTHSESGVDVSHKWFAVARFNEDGKIYRFNDFFDVTGFLQQHEE